ncbi:FAD-binding oxidoreductase [Yersinia enterocolitica]|uniref:FAD-dependent oxidoreductase n=1 Tax=Yersinia enterocolitica TaxID=630 RepID=UPI00155ADAD6|nr:FAD-dependent oxidoreductase [Yersinia enterocolitica]MBX9482626.1 FAD-binding oxidoreductase [Yersinia enterocolitica]NQS94632.1 FAD-binding oxidoreductase [Yersinia enterocolitica]NQT44842.1 FAD-binding oxidoreductase [Yersinia enterocolitica]NQT99331.1 FAD-binding oxidoreductase [Yersinia enterocolitica]HDL6874735.1 FAD-binding oxidoreductase [Yersinia enterocolitica]
MKKNILIIGGGFYGLYIAEHFALQGYKVLLCEKESEVMSRASYVNQARIHNGYHYPRSILTALRSRVSFPIFTEEFKDSIYNDFDKYYLIGRPLGYISAKQFKLFCERIGAPCRAAPDNIQSLVNSKYVETVFETKEWAFDTIKLREIMLQRLEVAGVELMLNSLVISVSQSNSSLLATIRTFSGLEEEMVFGQVFNCTYSMINSVNKDSGLTIIPFKHEMTEMCLVDVPDEIKKMSFTVMCGPFFSLMPFPSTNHHSFSHVRYTPHCDWKDCDSSSLVNAHEYFNTTRKISAWSKIRQDSMRYIPILGECEYISSLWEVKTILPASDNDDSRPILFMQDYGMKGYHCIMGGKIDNVYDAIDIIKQRGLDQV